MTRSLGRQASRFGVMREARSGAPVGIARKRIDNPRVQFRRARR
jgi:hypothetical protein